MSSDIRKRSPFSMKQDLPERDEYLGPPFRQSQPNKLNRTRWLLRSISSAALILMILVVLGRGRLFHPASPSPLQPLVNKLTAEDLEVVTPEGEVLGHGDFDDGRKCHTMKAFVDPESEGLSWVNVHLGNGG